MKKNMITVRNVDEEVLRKFKAVITIDEMKMGQALTKAMKECAILGIISIPKNCIQ